MNDKYLVIKDKKIYCVNTILNFMLKYDCYVLHRKVIIWKGKLEIKRTIEPYRSIRTL